MGGADAAALAATAFAEADPRRAPEDWDAWFEALSGRITRAGRAWDTPEMGTTADLAFSWFASSIAQLVEQVDDAGLDGHVQGGDGS